MKKAFTILELVFVIAVLGIIGVVGAKTLRIMYDNYISTTVNNRMQSETELALKQIANRLHYRLKDSVIAANSATFDGLTDARDDINYSRIEWVGYDIDGWLGTDRGGFNKPTWSGFIDVDALDTADANVSVLFSPETNTTEANNIITNLRPTGSLTTLDNAAIFFTGANTDVRNDYGWDGTAQDQNDTAAYRIKATTNLQQLVSATTQNFNNVDIYEMYKLAWTAYAISIEDFDGDGLERELVLYYDYQPWEGDDINNDTINRALLLEHVSATKAQAFGDSIKIVICVDNNTTGTTSSADLYSICKEKVVF